MDNITHSLLGLAAAKAGLERLSPAATSVCLIAANAPDADILALAGGRWAYLQHHRGITHSIIGVLALALLIPSLFWLVDFLIARIRGTPARIKFRGLLLASLIASATHPLLDWTNNYGIRPLLPWNSQWYYGDLVFIIDPWLWLLLGGSAFLLTAKNRWQVWSWTLFGALLTGAVVFAPMLRPGSQVPLASRLFWLAGIAALVIFHRARLAERWGSGIAIAALALVVVYWAGLSFAHRRALNEAAPIVASLAAKHQEVAGRVAAMPTLANPLRWQIVAETTGALYRFDLKLSGDGEAEKIAGEPVRYLKLQGEQARILEIASQERRAEIFLGFARFPVAQVEGGCFTQALVQFADLRYTEPGKAGRGTFSLEVPVECPPEVGAIEKQ